MKITRIYLIIGLMSLALLGIVGLQVRQILKAIDIQSQNFNLSVNDAMHDVVEQLLSAEVRTRFVKISREFDVVDMYVEAESGQGNFTRTIESGEMAFQQKIRIRDSMAIITEQEAFIDPTDTISGLWKGKEAYVFVSEGTDSTVMQLRGNPQLIEIINQTVYDLQSLPFRLEDRMDSLQVDTLLRQSLQAQGIFMDFHFMVMDEGNEKVYFKTRAGGPSAMHKSRHRVHLFPSISQAHKNYLYLSFPRQRFHMIRGVWFQVVASLLFSGIILVCFGITIRTIFRQKQLSEMKNDFINNMTHELKTPIATISLAADALNNPKIQADPMNIDRYTGIIKVENQRMHRQVERVLQAALFSRKELDLRLSKVDMHDLIQNAAQSLRLQVQERQGQLHLQLQAEQAILLGDAEHLSTVIFNLLDNANKYSPQAPRIRVKTQIEKEWFVLEVQDQGLGISKADQARIFHRFYRVSTGNLHETKGFGLGLSHVKEIVEAHQGKVQVESQPGVGSTFRIRLPLQTTESNG